MGKEDTNPCNNLEDNRIIYVNGNFNEEMTKNIYEKLIALETKDPRKDIFMVIDSYGGYCHSFLAIHDAMKMCRCDVATFCIGKAMSCGQMLLMSGTKGKRFASPNCRILVHQLSSACWGTLSEMQVEVTESEEIQKIMDKIILENTGMTKRELKKLMLKVSVHF